SILPSSKGSAMLFSRQMTPSSTVALCRALRHGLGAGLTLVQVFRLQAQRGEHGVRPLAIRLLPVLEDGQDLTCALATEKEAVPRLFHALVKVGEETGHLAEVAGELEKYYALQAKLHRQFRSQCMAPLIQLGLAFLILAGVILVLGTIASSRP